MIEIFYRSQKSIFVSISFALPHPDVPEQPLGRHLVDLRDGRAVLVLLEERINNRWHGVKKWQIWCRLALSADNIKSKICMYTVCQFSWWHFFLKKVNEPWIIKVKPLKKIPGLFPLPGTLPWWWPCPWARPWRHRRRPWCWRRPSLARSPCRSGRRRGPWPAPRPRGGSRSAGRGARASGSGGGCRRTCRTWKGRKAQG